MLPERGSPADWLRFAQSDLDDAAGPPRRRVLFETLCFHAHQAVEKSLKAVLVAEGIPFPRTHNLKILLELLPPEPCLPADVADVAKLTDYAVSARYPGIEEPVSEEEYREAVRLAQKVVEWAEDALGRAGSL